MALYTPDRSQYPAKKPDGTLDIDLASGKYLKLWQGPNHPGITGNMSVMPVMPVMPGWSKARPTSVTCIAVSRN